MITQPRPGSQIADDLLGDLDDPNSEYAQLVAAGDHQAVLGFTFAKVSLINIPADQVSAASRFLNVRDGFFVKINN